MLDLTVPANNFDQTTSFNVSVEKYSKLRGNTTTIIKCRLFWAEDEQKFYALNDGSCLKVVYSDADKLESNRLAGQEALKHGDIVRISGKEYKMHVSGIYSDLGYFIAI